jgi:hypothetical protein
MGAASTDAMHDKVVQTLDRTECNGCARRPELMWAWDNVDKLAITKDIDAAARTFTENAVEHLKVAGWQMHGEQLYCPDCAAKQQRSS